MAAFTSDERTSKTNLPAHVDILRRGSIAASNVPGVGVFIFFQDTDGFIRETQYIKGKYQGGDKASRIKIADDMKYRGPLAAVEGRNQDAVITIIYISKSNIIRGLRWDGGDRQWKPLEGLNALNTEANPDSKLAVLRFNQDKAIRIYYQDPGNDLHELCFDGSGEWYTGGYTFPAIVGSSLGCGKWLEDNGDLREIQVFHQAPNNEGVSTWYLPTDNLGWREGKLHPRSTVPVADF
ncbi:hypothetical protein G7Y79_00038g074590 [Physcia stellaris]|nr:hypothetical protein G7Y79_00038g074590 [Physcia stellaris]